MVGIMDITVITVIMVTMVTMVTSHTTVGKGWRLHIYDLRYFGTGFPVFGHVPFQACMVLNAVGLDS